MNSLLTDHGDWRIVTSVLTDVLNAQFGLTVLPSSAARQVRPVIENVSGQQYRLVIPIGEEAGKPVVAMGTLQAKPGEILEKLLGVAVQYIRQGRRLEEQRLELDAHAGQISRDFEELTCLRGLLQHLKDGDGCGSAEQLAEAVLIPLCSLVGAEQIVLVSADPQGTPPGEAVPSVGEAVVRVAPGGQVVDDQSCCRLVDRLREVAGGQALVQTGMKRRREFSMVPDVDSCILVPVIREESLLGWLLAANRTPRAADSRGVVGTAGSDLPENEFGTFEANLLDSAAVILAAHGRCAELFRQGAAADMGA